MKTVIGWRWVLAATVGHFALALFVLSIAPFDGQVLPVWPTTGLSLAFVAWGGARFGLAAMLGVATAVLTVGAPGQAAMVSGVGHLLESIVGGTLLARRLNRQQPFHTLREVLWLPVAALAAAAANAGLITLAMGVARRSFWPGTAQDTLAWWLGDAMGGVIVAPMMLGILALRRSDWSDRRTPLSVGLVLASAVLSWVVFSDASQGLLNTESFAFILFPVTVCLALRGSPLALAAMNVVVSAIGLLATAQGQGPFAADNMAAALARLQLFLFVLCGTGLILAALNEQWSAAQKLADERLNNLQAILNSLPSVAWPNDELGQTRTVSDKDREVIGLSAEEALRHANQELERRVANRTSDLKSSQRLIEILADVAPVGIFKTDAAGACEYVNRRWSEIAGLTLEQALGEGWTGSLHPEDRQQVFDAWRRSAHSGVHFQEEFRVLDSKGRGTWVLGQARALRDDHGAVTGYVGTITDITAHKDAEGRLQRQQNELSHVGRLNTIGEMSAAMVHELGQPLTAITSYAAGCLVRIEGKNGGSPGLVDALKEIENEAKRAGEILRLMRNFIGKRPPTRSELDVNRAVLDTLAIAGYESRRKGIALQIDLAEPAPLVRADAVELQQVLLNLVRNAKEALIASAVVKPFVRVTTRQNERGEIEITVCDNGPGIAPDIARAAFEPFRTTKPEGLGLGLAICRSIVESLGGRLALVDNSAQGAVFCCTLPAAMPTAGKPHG